MQDRSRKDIFALNRLLANYFNPRWMDTGEFEFDSERITFVKIDVTEVIDY